jgi:hypothetical protein
LVKLNRQRLLGDTDLSCLNLLHIDSFFIAPQSGLLKPFVDASGSPDKQQNGTPV